MSMTNNFNYLRLAKRTSPSLSKRSNEPCLRTQLESPRPEQAVICSHMSTLGVEERESHGTSEGSRPKRPTPSHVEAGYQGHNAQARKNHYTKLNADHSVSLLSCMGKLSRW